MECAALGILVGAGILKCVSIDPSHGNVGNLLCCVADTLIHNPTADVLPVPGDDGADADADGPSNTQQALDHLKVFPLSIQTSCEQSLDQQSLDLCVLT